MKNKHGPNAGIEEGFRQWTATRGDPDIGKYKRGRAPCPETLITLLIKRKAGVTDWLDANTIAGIKVPEWEKYALSFNGISYNAARSSTLTGLKKTRDLLAYVVSYLGMISDLSACVAPDSVKIQNRYATVTGLSMISDLSACVAPDSVKIQNRYATVTGLGMIIDLSACVAPDSVKIQNRYATVTGFKYDQRPVSVHSS